MTHTFTLKKEDQVYKAILTIFNFNMNLTEKEINIVSDMLKHKITTLDTASRKILYTHSKSQYVFNNYIKRLKAKGVLLDNNGVLVLNPVFERITKEREVTFKFVHE